MRFATPAGNGWATSVPSRDLLRRCNPPRAMGGERKSPPFRAEALNSFSGQELEPGGRAEIRGIQISGIFIQIGQRTVSTNKCGHYVPLAVPQPVEVPILALGLQKPQQTAISKPGAGPGYQSIPAELQASFKRFLGGHVDAFVQHASPIEC